MAKKLTITIDDEVYQGLYRVVGARRISRFIERVVRPFVMDLDAAYSDMAADEEREREALIWSEAFISEQDHDSNEAW